MVSYVRSFIRMIRGFRDESRIRALYNSLYTRSDTPKTLGTKIRG